MSVWKIEVLYYGKITLPKSATTPNLDDNLIYDCPYLGFLLHNDARNILVDTGISESFIVDGKAWGGWPAEGGVAYVHKALAGVKLKPDDIETVIYTHLHNDHAGNCGLFKNARMIVQKDEWRNLLDPLPDEQVRGDYDQSKIQELRNLSLYMIDGDVELIEGIRIYKTPGHSLGSQSVAVTTQRGTVVLTGDTFILNCNAFPHQKELIDMEGNRHPITQPAEVYKTAFPSTIVYNFYAWWESVKKIKAIAAKDQPGYIIPGHEPSLLITGV